MKSALPLIPASREGLAETLRAAIDFHHAGRLADAETAYRQILSGAPDFAPAWHGLGILAGQNGNFVAAETLLRRAIAFDSENAEFHLNLAIVLRSTHRTEELIAECRESLRYDRRCVLAWTTLANALFASGEIDEAAAACEEAIGLAPDDPTAHNTLAICRESLGESRLAVKSCRRALALDPQNAAIHSNLICALLFDPSCDVDGMADECQRWNQHFGAPFRNEFRVHANALDPERRLRIGYVSPDFRNHVVSHVLLPLLQSRDRAGFEVYCYSNTDRPDFFTERIRAAADVWREIKNVSDQSAAEIVRFDGLDILVDLALHSANNRLPLFARRPAPVQISYLGYCGITGLETIDAHLSDPYFHPANVNSGGPGERISKLPQSYWCYQPSPDAPPVNELPMVRNGVVTYGNLNSFAKLSEPALDLWIEILRLVPRSRLLLYAPKGKCRDRLRKRLSVGGVSDDRLELVGRQPRGDYFATYRRIDIGLDPFPYNGGITTCDTLWMGVPVVSLLGNTPIGRGGYSILSNVGLTELVAASPEKYVEIAVSLARNVPRLSSLRSALRERLEQSPLCDVASRARDLEWSYRAAWRTWCASMK